MWTVHIFYFHPLDCLRHLQSRGSKFACVVCRVIIFRLIFGLSKERPILGDHPKAHIHEIRLISCGFHVKSGGFHADFMKSGGFQVKSGRFHVDFMKSGGFQVKSARFHEICGFQVKSSGFHEIRRISKDQLPGMVSPMFETLACVPDGAVSFLFWYF